jgi:hypothetical protein
MRPITVQAGPFAAAAATAVTAAQTAAAAGQYLLNGTLVTTTWTGTGYFVGTLFTVSTTTTGGLAAGDKLSALGLLSGATILAPGPTAGTWVTNTSQTLFSSGSPGTIAANGVANLVRQQQLALTTAGADVGKTVTLIGTNANGDIVTEAVTLVSTGTVNSVLDYLTVTSAVVSAATANTLTIGTGQIGGSTWVRLDDWALPQVPLQVVVTGTITYTVEQTMDDPNDPSQPIAMSAVTWVVSADANVVAKSAGAMSWFIYPPRYARIRTTAGAGSARMTITQPGVADL